VSVAACALFVVVMGAPAQARGGDLDPSFGDDGIVVADLGGSDDGRAVAVRPDGRIVALGTSDGDYALTRFLPSGRLDGAFASSGVAIVDADPVDDARDVVLQPDGKIVAVGVSGGNFAVLRFLPAGSLDARFGSGGIAVADFSPLTDDEPYGVALQTDGKIVLAGVAGGAFGLARFLPSGRPDPGFGNAGLVTTDVRPVCCWDVAFDVALQTDGRILAAGASVPVAGGSGGDVALARYLPDGRLDRSFGGDGIVVTDAGTGQDSSFEIALEPDARIVLAGQSGDRFGMLRYLPDGRLDPSFGRGGRVSTDLGPLFDLAASVLLQHDGKIVAGGMSMHAPGADASGRRRADFALVRYTSRGRLDPAFGTGGVVRTDLGGFNQIVGLAGQRDGRIVAVGRSAPPEDLILARYLAR
jgi:uncharacterized delta-60 repeat protein